MPEVQMRISSCLSRKRKSLRLNFSTVALVLVWETKVYYATPVRPKISDKNIPNDVRGGETGLRGAVVPVKKTMTINGVESACIRGGETKTISAVDELKSLMEMKQYIQYEA